MVVIYSVDTRGLSSSTFTARFIIEGSQQSTRFNVNSPISSKSVESVVEKVQNSKSWWSPWTSWSRCSSLCGGCGTKKRRRLCIGPDDNCQGYRSQEAVCGDAICGRITFGNRVQKFCCPGFEIIDGQCQAVKHL
uniref:Uncharacterized protein n=1 Tax=Romanomermis culicivorax TaxID=13658 RepID=A0A915HVH4_ROMCU